ncbi:hypothetical protein Tco_1546683, partial [Tanacetum coccineum]
MESSKDRQVGIDNLRRYEVGLLKVKDTLLLRRKIVVVTSYVWVEKSLLGSKECEFGGVGEQVHADISKQGRGGNELVSNDTIVDIDSMGGRIGSQVIVKCDVVTILAGYSVTKFCIKNVGLSLFDEVHMLRLNLKSSQNLKFCLEPELMVMVIGYIFGVVVDDSCDNFALVKWPNKKNKYTHQLVYLVQCLDQNKYKLYIGRLSDITFLKFDESDDERVTEVTIGLFLGVIYGTIRFWSLLHGIHHKVNSRVNSIFICRASKTEEEHNGHRIYQLTNEITQLKQANYSIEMYYQKLNGLWYAIDALEALYMCTCNCVCANGRLNEARESRKRLLQFLMGLDECFANVRGQILLMQSLPNATKAYAMMRQEEKQRETNTPKFSTPAVMLTFNSSRTLNNQNVFPNTGNSETTLSQTPGKVLLNLVLSVAIIKKKASRQDGASTSEPSTSGGQTGDVVFAKMDSLQNQLNQVMMKLQYSQ